MSDSPKIAVVGAGRWGKNLVSNLNAIGCLEAVVDSSEYLRAAIAEDLPHLKLYASIDNLLESKSVDAVAVATPAPTHFDIASRCLEAGLDVFCEKPITLCSTEARNLCAMAKERERVLMVGHLLLYQPAVAWMRAYLSDGKLGKVYSLHQERKKLGVAREHENALWSLGVHDIAVMLYLVGENPEKVSAVGHAGLKEGVEDDVYAHLTFPSGVVAHVHNSWLWPENRRRLTVVGEKGMLVYDEVKQNITLHRKTIDSERQNQDYGEEVVFEGSTQPLRGEMEHFVECVKDRSVPISSGESGLAVVEVLEAAATSINQN